MKGWDIEGLVPVFLYFAALKMFQVSMPLPKMLFNANTCGLCVDSSGAERKADMVHTNPKLSKRYCQRSKNKSNK